MKKRDIKDVSDHELLNTFSNLMKHYFDVSVGDEVEFNIYELKKEILRRMKT